MNPIEAAIAIVLGLKGAGINLVATLPDVNLADVFQGHKLETLQLAEWDDHPNQLGHRLVADALYNALAANPATLFGAGPSGR